MQRRITAVLLIALLAVLALAGTAQAATTNAFGLTYAGQQNCTGCHESGGISQAYLQSRHGAFMAVIDPLMGGSLDLAVPAVGSDLWPSPSGGEEGIQFNAQDLFLQVGAPGVMKEYIAKYKGGDATNSLGQYTIPAITPADDYPIFDPMGFRAKSTWSGKAKATRWAWRERTSSVAAAATTWASPVRQMPK